MHPAKRSKLSYKVCPHCQKELNIRTYKDHKRLYFNEETKSWFQTPVGNSDSEISPPPSPDAEVLPGPSPISVLEEPVDDVVLPPDTQSAHNYRISPGLSVPQLSHLDVYMYLTLESEFWVEDAEELTADIHPVSPPSLPPEDDSDSDNEECEAVGCAFYQLISNSSFNV